MDLTYQHLNYEHVHWSQNVDFKQEHLFGFFKMMTLQVHLLHQGFRLSFDLNIPFNQLSSRGMKILYQV